MAESRTAQEWKQFLCQLNGILAAHVVQAGDGTPLEIHVLAGSDKKPKAVARDVQSALMSRYNIEVDHQIISVAQIRSELAERLGFRLRFCGVDTKVEGRSFFAVVTLARGNSLYKGEAHGTNTAFSRKKCVAQATLNAIHECTAGDLELGGVECVTLFGKNIIVTQIYSAPDNRCYVGSAVADPDADAAAVHSVLAALNRRIAMSMQGD